MDAIKCIMGRRSIRDYNDYKLTKSEFDKLFSISLMAPSGGNSQPWKFIIIQNERIINKIRNSIFDQSIMNKLNLKNIEKFGMLFNAKNVIAVCVRLVKVPSNMDEILSNIEIPSVSAAIQNILLSSFTLGFCSCWCRVLPFYRKEIENLLSISDPYYLLAFITIGKTDKKEYIKGLRKPIKQHIEYIE